MPLKRDVGMIKDCRRQIITRHSHLSRSNIKVKSNGASVPVSPAVIMPINCAQNMDVANEIENPPMKNDIIAVTDPIATPVKKIVRKGSLYFHSLEAKQNYILPR